MNTDTLLIKTKTSKERNNIILDFIFDLEENKQEVLNTFDKSELNADKKNNNPIFVDFKKLYLIKDLDPEFIWNLYSYKCAYKPYHDVMKHSYFLWSKKNEDTFIKLLESEINYSTKYTFLIIMNSLIHQYKYKSYVDLLKDNKDIINNILKFYLIDKNAASDFKLNNEFKKPKTDVSLFDIKNIEYINKAFSIYFLNLM